MIIKPAAHLDRLDEALVITSVQPRFSSDQQQDMATSEALKGPQAEADEEQAQKKASEVLAERLPGLMEPNVPPDQQPLNDASNPNPVSRPPMPLHPDRFSPGAAPVAGPGDASETAPPATTPKSTPTPTTGTNKSPEKPAPKPNHESTPQRNP